MGHLKCKCYCDSRLDIDMSPFYDADFIVIQSGNRQLARASNPGRVLDLLLVPSLGVDLSARQSCAMAINVLPGKLNIVAVSEPTIE
jgi:hypothetical protein